VDGVSYLYRQAASFIMVFFHDTKEMTQQPKPLSANTLSPIVAGAIGGSGTRVLTQILCMCGIDMGCSLDSKTWDSLPLREYLATEFSKLAIGCMKHEPDLSLPTISRLRTAIQKHRGSAEADTRWGWKNPRSMWLIPFFAHCFPDMFFILLVRDGRDIALSRNKFLLRSSGKQLLWDASYPSEELFQLALWEKGNRCAIQNGQSMLGERFIIVRYEDLCSQPLQTIDRLLASLKINHSSCSTKQLLKIIEPSRSIGRGEILTREKVIPESTMELLRDLGYTT
jgi:hypothetical protein